MQVLLGERIRELRIAANLTQEQIAVQTGISRQRYARIENGTNNITLELLTKLAKVLEVTVGDITRVLDEKPKVSYRTGEGTPADILMIYDMIYLLHANKSRYERLRKKSGEEGKCAEGATKGDTNCGGGIPQQLQN